MAEKEGVKVEITSDLDYGRGSTKRLLIEEFFNHRPTPERFHAAVATPPFVITIV